MEMTIENLSHGYRRVLDVVSRGERVAPRGEATRELLGFQLHVQSTNDVLPLGSGRPGGINRGLALELATQLIAGVYLPARLRFNSPHFVDDDRLENYGPLLAPGVARSVRYLQEDPHTRRAAANLGHTGGDSGYPCTLGLGWVIRDGHLHGFSEMRSQDAWLGLPYDLFMFAALQRTMAAVLGVEPGPMHHRVRSFHIYERDLLKADDVNCGRPNDTMWVPGDDWEHVVRLAQRLLGLG